MPMFRCLLLGCLLALSAAVTSSVRAYTPLPTPPASAYTTTMGPGPLVLTAVDPFPCHATFVVTINASGGASITQAVITRSSGDSSFCPTITANGLPWSIGTPTYIYGSGIPGTYAATISGISMTFNSFHATCTGSATLMLDNGAGTASISGTLHNGSEPCGLSATGFTTLVRAP